MLEREKLRLGGRTEQTGNRNRLRAKSALNPKIKQLTVVRTKIMFLLSAYRS